MRHHARGLCHGQVTLAEAQQRLPELLAAVEQGEQVEIDGSNGRTFRLVTGRPRPPITGVPKAGRRKGQIVVPDDFDQPLDEFGEYMQ